ncbi:glycosyltransferase family 2 protein [Vibrio parahaemolyticus]|uniref:glycosyltransferase family 2 protein n=2 Tax=Vibrio parahaemolyticus TaxID=670 RepID=UPI000417EA6D|nr:glycosyltransferase family A protein [Vibrio parahaemolyticus]EJT0909245.1 glycosyltransferase family 2 protein [Vibrio parahaemolyticus]
MLDLSILISSYDPKIGEIDKLLSSIPQSCDLYSYEVVFVIQSSQSFKKQIFEFQVLELFTKYSIDNFKIDFIDSVGVTRSRNHALSLASGHVIVFCDDDVIYLPNALNLLIEEHYRNPSIDFYTTKVKNPRLFDFKPYKTAKFCHTTLSILSCGTIEISVKARVKEYAKFPHDLGAGALLPNCDEPVFLSRIMKFGGVGYYIPLGVCIHPECSSGQTLATKEEWLSRLTAFRYIFGKIPGSGLFLLFCLKKYKLLFKFLVK